MREVILVFILAFLSSQAAAQVPYYKVRYEDGVECRYFYSGVQNGKENLIDVECFDNKRQ